MLSVAEKIKIVLKYALYEISFWEKESKFV